MRPHPELEKVVEDFRGIASEVAGHAEREFCLALFTESRSKEPAIENSTIWIGCLAPDVKTDRKHVLAVPVGSAKVATIEGVVDDYCKVAARAGALLPYTVQVGWREDSPNDGMAFLRFFWERFYSKVKHKNEPSEAVLSASPPKEAALLLEREFFADSVMHDGGFVVSEDYRTVRCGSHSFDFTKKQSSAVQELFETSRAGTKSLGNDSLLKACGSDQKQISRVFRGNPAWGTLIVPAPGQGMYRLADPTELLNKMPLPVTLAKPHCAKNSAKSA